MTPLHAALTYLEQAVLKIPSANFGYQVAIFRGLNPQQLNRYSDYIYIEGFELFK
jgi:hypothetical protein